MSTADATVMRLRDGSGKISQVSTWHGKLLWSAPGSLAASDFSVIYFPVNLPRLQIERDSISVFDECDGATDGSFR